ncbi:MAG: CAP domain-containing protein [Blautia sp.]|jgi:uncharacterized protein YkwD
MKRIWRKAMVLVLAAAMMGAPVSAAAKTSAVEAADELLGKTYPASCSEKEWEILRYTNNERAKVGEQPLTAFGKLQEAAHVRSKELVELFDHMRPDGSVCFTALQEAKIQYYAAGENIAAGSPTAEGTIHQWMNSPGHRGNILSGDFSHLGAGYYYSSGSMWTNNWVQLFVGSCSFTGLEIVGVEGGLVVEKGTDLNDLGLICKLRCSHGNSYMPLDEAYCSGYHPEKDNGEAQTVTVNVLGQKQTFSVTIPIALDKSALTVKNAKTTYNGAHLEWNPVKGADAYAVYRAVKGGKYQRIRNTSGTSFDDKNLVTGQTYYYKIRAYQRTGNGNVYANPGKTCKVIPTLEKAKLTKLTGSSKKMTAAWERVAGASGYELWYKTGNGTYKKARNIQNGGTLTANHLRLKGKTTYTYKVRAFRLVGGKRVYGDYSDAMSGRTL